MSVGFVLHAHLYQPPREDPWLGAVPREPSAAPYHDWNARIHEECYGPLTAARLLDRQGRVTRFVNTLAGVSFDAAPTLLRWLEREEPSTYRAVLDADRVSAARLGHGNAIATPYHHLILPLASPRDRRTEIRWGLADFRARFGREPEGFWLPEAAVDRATLQALADEGIAFTIVGSGQIQGTPPADGRAGRVTLDGGRDIAVFAYDGALAHAVSFGGLVRDALAWADAVRERAAPDSHGGSQLISMATDGETFGHHHHFGDLALARLLDELGRDADVRVENYASALAQLGTAGEVDVVSPSAWSCAHGVGRWERDCGCRAGADTTSQAWRAPLRRGLDQMADSLHTVYERECREAGVDDPWGLRDAFGTVIDADLETRRRFVASAAPAAPPERLLRLLEMEREVLAQFTSCAWFFDDVAGLETLNVLRSAARALDLAATVDADGGASDDSTVVGDDDGGHEEGAAPDGSGDGGDARNDAAAAEAALRETLAKAESNDPARGDARTLWDTEVRTAPPAPWRAAAVGGFRAALGAARHPVEAGAFTVRPGDAGGVAIVDRRTGREWHCTLEIDLDHERAGIARVSGGVRMADDERTNAPADLEVGPAALPYPWSRDVRALVRSRLLARLLPTAQRAALLTGSETLVRACCDAITALAAKGGGTGDHGAGDRDDDHHDDGDCGDGDYGDGDSCDGRDGDGHGGRDGDGHGDVVVGGVGRDDLGRDGAPAAERDNRRLRDADHLVSWLIELTGSVPPRAQAGLAAARESLGPALDPILIQAGVIPPT